MKRVLILAMSAMALTLAAPGAALAHRGHHKIHLTAEARVKAGLTRARGEASFSSKTSGDAGTVSASGHGVATLNHGSVSGKVTVCITAHLTPPAILQGAELPEVL